MREYLRTGTSGGSFRIRYVERDYDISKLVASGRAVVLYRVRRASKSYLAYGYLLKLIEEGLDERETLILNLEDPRLVGIAATDLMRFLRST